MKSKTLSGILAGLALMLASVGHATPVTYTGKHEVGAPLRGLNPKELTLFEFDPAIDTLSDLSVTLNFTGTGNGWKGKDISLWLGNQRIGAGQTSGSVTINLAATPLISEADHTLKLKWNNGLGNISFTSYDISFTAMPGLQAAAPPVTARPGETQAVPAPSTLALLSLGLLGTVFLGRRRKKNVTH